MKQALVIVALLMMSGCSALTYNRNAPPIRTVRIEPFACNCPDSFTPQSVRNVITALILQYGRVEVVEDGAADCVIDGTITFTEGSAGRGRASGFTGNVAADYATGKHPTFVSIRALRGSTLLATGTAQQALGGNAGVIPPETLANRAAVQIIKPLYRQGMKPR